MDWYSFFELLHVICAILWVGGGFTLMVAAELVRRKRGPGGMMAIVDAVALLGPPFFVPVSLLTVVFGATTAFIGPGFGTLWVDLGLAGFIVTFLNGFFGIKPRAEKISALIATQGPESPEVLARADNLMMIARFDYVMLALVVVDMVVKPGVNDVGLLTAMAVILVAGGYLTLGSAIRKQPAAA
ncbi:MAG TPA: hypothetical protein VIL84_04085 [Devosiaceae bacterium]